MCVSAGMCALSVYDWLFFLEWHREYLVEFNIDVLGFVWLGSALLGLASLGLA